MKDVIIKTMLSIKYDLTHAYQDVVGVNFKNEVHKSMGQVIDLFDQCFEIIKFKMIIDDQFKVWLIGVDQAPQWITDLRNSTQIERE